MSLFYSDGLEIRFAPPKSPGSMSVIDYAEDWELWLASGETITTSAWYIDSAEVAIGETVNGLTLNDAASTTTKTAAWLTGGNDGTDYLVTNKVTTSSTPPRTESRSMWLPCRVK